MSELDAFIPLATEAEKKAIELEKRQMRFKDCPWCHTPTLTEDMVKNHLFELENIFTLIGIQRRGLRYEEVYYCGKCNAEVKLEREQYAYGA